MPRKLFIWLRLCVILALLNVPAQQPANARRETQAYSPETNSELSEQPVTLAPAHFLSQSELYLPFVFHQLPPLDPIIPETTNILSETTTTYLAGVSADQSVYTFTQTTEALEALAPGDIIVSEPTGLAPNGFLRQVVEVSSTNDLVVIETKSATLEDAIQQGEVNITQVLMPENTDAVLLAPGVTLMAAEPAASTASFYLKIENVLVYDDDGNPNTTWDQVLANGSIELAPTLNFSLRVKDWNLEYLHFTTSATETSDLTFVTKLEKSWLKADKLLATYMLPAFTVMIGPVPVVFTPVLGFHIGVDGKVHVDISTGVKEVVNLTGGLEYRNGAWAPIIQHSKQFTFTPPSLSTGMDLKGYANAQLVFLIYGIAGPYCGIETYLKLEADPIQTPWWSLYGGLEMPVGVRLEVLSHFVAGFSQTVLAHKVLIAQAPSSSLPAAFNKISPSNGETNQTTSLTLDWGDSSGVTSYAYCYDTTNDNACSNWVSTGTTSQASISGLANSTTYYWQARATNAGGTTYANGSSTSYWSFTTGSGGVLPGEMITIPAGEFQMGCHPDHNGGYSCPSNELPIHPIYLDAYRIDTYEVTNAQYAQCVAAGSCPAPQYNSSYTRSSYYGNPTYANYPVIYVSWQNANAYCTWAGKRLPTEAEWEKAARGSTVRAYPWGDGSPTCALANFGGTSGCVGDTSQVGSYPAGASPYGVMDMAGNVWEWVADWYSSSYYSTSPYSNPTGPATGTDKVLRGGSWDDIDYDLRTAYRYDILTPTVRLYNVGFRCAAPPGP